MPSRYSKLVSFLHKGLDHSTYPNMKWVNEADKKFSLRLAKFLSKGPWQDDERLLKDYEKLMERKYEGYSKARGTLRSALNGSDFLVRISGNLRTQAIYQFKANAIAKIKNELLCDDETSSSSAELSSSSSQSSGGSFNMHSLNDHSYAKDGDHQMDGHVDEDWNSASVPEEDFPGMGFEPPPIEDNMGVYQFCEELEMGAPTVPGCSTATA